VLTFPRAYWSAAAPTVYAQSALPVVEIACLDIFDSAPGRNRLTAALAVADPLLPLDTLLVLLHRFVRLVPPALDGGILSRFTLFFNMCALDAYAW
jgi:hypothetical protein